MAERAPRPGLRLRAGPHGGGGRESWTPRRAAATTPGLAGRSADPAMIGKLEAYAAAHLDERSRRDAETAVANIADRIRVRGDVLPAIDAWLASTRLCWRPPYRSSDRPANLRRPSGALSARGAGRFPRGSAASRDPSRAAESRAPPPGTPARDRGRPRRSWRPGRACPRDRRGF